MSHIHVDVFLAESLHAHDLRHLHTAVHGRDPPSTVRSPSSCDCWRDLDSVAQLGAVCANHYVVLPGIDLGLLQKTICLIHISFGSPLRWGWETGLALDTVCDVQGMVQRSLGLRLWPFEGPDDAIPPQANHVYPPANLWDAMVCRVHDLPTSFIRWLP